MSFPGSERFKREKDMKEKRLYYGAKRLLGKQVSKTLDTSSTSPGSLFTSTLVTSTSSALPIIPQLPVAVHALSVSKDSFPAAQKTHEVSGVFKEKSQRRRHKPIFFTHPMNDPVAKVIVEQPAVGSCGSCFCCFSSVDSDPQLSTKAPRPPTQSLNFDIYEAFGGIGSGSEAFKQLNCEGIHHGHKFTPTHTYCGAGGFDFNLRKTQLSKLQYAAVGLARPIPLFSGGFNARPETLKRARVEDATINSETVGHVKKKRKKNDECASYIFSDSDDEGGDNEGSIEYGVEKILAHAITEDGAFHFMVECTGFEADWWLSTPSLLRSEHDRALLKVYLKPYGLTIAGVQHAEKYSKHFIIRKKSKLSRAKTVTTIAQVKAGHHGIFLITASCKNVSLLP